MGDGRHSWDASALLDLLRQGERVRLSNRPEDPRQFHPMDSDATLWREAADRYGCRIEIVFNDGSCTAASREETLDEAAAHARLAQLLADRHTVVEARGR